MVLDTNKDLLEMKKKKKMDQLAYFFLSLKKNPINSIIIARKINLFQKWDNFSFIVDSGILKGILPWPAKWESGIQSGKILLNLINVQFVYWDEVHSMMISLTFSLQPLGSYVFCRTQEEPAYTRVFNFCSFVRSFVRLPVRPSPLCAKYSYTAIIPRTHNFFKTHSVPPIKWLIGVPIRGLEDHYDPHGVKYFGKLLTSNFMLVILGEYTDPKTP